MLLWVDMEMTGLDERKDSILEIAAVITDWDFNTLEEFHEVVFQVSRRTATVLPQTLSDIR